MMNNMSEQWWKQAVIYQIYPKSFQDSNGDGIGDIPGIISRLDYLKKLGIDGIWLSPVYRSPQDDNGYDISDYQDIDPMFGTMKDMETLIKEAGKRGIRIIMDLVLNHTSDEHPWFREARKGKDNPWHDFYVWRDGTEGKLPNDLKSVFGGPAWQWEPACGQYYLHQFSVRQPDLNWENPRVRQELYAMIRWWMEKGVGGFRLDVIDRIAKEPDLKITEDGPGLHQMIRELNRETFGGGDYMTVGEAWSATPENARLYSNPDGSEFSMVFQFEHILLDQQPGGEKWDLAPLSLRNLKKVIGKWQTSLYGCGWNSLFWNNQDLPRIVPRWGDDGAFREESAKMLAILLHGLQGTPYIYQGEELGMTNVDFALEDYRDIETLNLYKERMALGYPEEKIMESIRAKSRDNARTPMQWEDAPGAGFTTGEPWIPLNPNYRLINAADQADREDSIFACYRQLIRLRKEWPVFVKGRFVPLDEENPRIFSYERRMEQPDQKGGRLVVVCNFYGEKEKLSEDLPLEGMKLIFSNYPGREGEKELLPYEARMYLKD